MDIEQSPSGQQERVRIIQAIDAHSHRSDLPAPLLTTIRRVFQLPSQEFIVACRAAELARQASTDSQQALQGAERVLEKAFLSYMQSVRDRNGRPHTALLATSMEIPSVDLLARRSLRERLRHYRRLLERATSLKKLAGRGSRRVAFEQAVGEAEEALERSETDASTCREAQERLLAATSALDVAHGRLLRILTVLGARELLEERSA